MKEQTLNNRLTALTRTGAIHRQLDSNGDEVRGVYGLGPAPAPTPEDGQDADSDSSN